MKKHSLELLISSIPVSEQERHQLQQLQQSLGLKKEIIDSIEAQVTQAYEQKLRQYQEAFTRAIHQQYPLSAQAHQLLQHLQQSLEIREKISDKIEAQVTQAYEQKLQQYQEAFTRASHQQYPLNQDTYHELQQLQQELGLIDKIVALIEERVTAPIQAEHQRKLQQYEQAFIRAIQRQPLNDDAQEVLEPLSDVDREVLEHYRRVLNLTQEVTQSIENQVTQAYKQKLQQYEEALTRAIHQQYPLSDEVRQPLQLLQRNLELRNEITESIAVKVIQAYEQKLQEYKKALTWASQRQYLLSDEDREFLEYRRQKLSLSKNITDFIEAKVTETQKQTLPEPEEFVPDGSEQQSFLKDDTCPLLPPEPIGLNSITPVVAPIKKPVTKQGGEHKRKVRRLRLQATVVAALISVGAITYYAYTQRLAAQSEKAALEQTEDLKERKEYEECVHQVKAVPQQSRFYIHAQNLLNQCQYLAQDEKWLTQAKDLEKENNFKDAIAAATKIQSYSSFHPEAQQLIDHWSEKLLKLAEAQYQQSDNSKALENAVDITTVIPKTSSVAKKAEETVKKWQTEWNNNENYLKAAQNALNEQKWQEAKVKANTVRLLGQEVKRNTPYWQNKMKPVIETAEERITASKSQKAATNQSSTRNRAGSRRVGSKKVGPRIVGSRRVGPKKVGSGIINPRNVRPRKVSPRIVRSRNVRPNSSFRRRGFLSQPR